jgi:NADPH:quinone reductase-like Zn-dependent oxidoreductase
MLAMTISPADLMQLDGRYGTSPVLPYVPGHEGVAVVLEVADDVRGLVPGDRVSPMGAGGCWTDERVMSHRHLIRIVRQADVLQSAMLTANPASAWVMLRHLRALAPGNWVIQNAANSAVGQCVRQIGAHMGLNVINVVRRPDAIQAQEVESNRWLLDDSSGFTLALREQAVSATNGAPIHLALDAVGGDASQALASSSFH